MKQLFLIIAILVGGWQFQALADSPEDEYGFYLGEDPDSDSSSNPINHPDENPYKSVQLATLCTISRQNGVMVDGVNISAYIVLFEVYDESGLTVASFNDETSFISYILSSESGSYLIKFHLTTGSSLSGWLNI